MAGARRLSRRTYAPGVMPMHEAVTLRYGFPDDVTALWRLAALDSAEVPEGQLLIAEVGGELWAAISLSDGSVIADPFRRTAALVGLLRERARQLNAPGPGYRPGRSRSRRTATASG
jgi:hypothetical protein